MERDIDLYVEFLYAYIRLSRAGRDGSGFGVGGSGI